MRFFSSSLANSLLLAVAALVGVAQAGISVTITNRCDHDLAPIASYINGGISYVGDSKGNGGSWSFTVPDGSCPYPDGPECTFQVDGGDWCNISNVSGYKDPATFEWACGSYTCNSADCVEAYLPDLAGRNPCT
ncbi:hypothetical protein BCR35DRAFT_325583, partial [Leucosporidium creatinivorum]